MCWYNAAAMSQFPLTLAIALAVAVPLVLARAYARIADDVVDEWARARGLELAPEHRPVVASYLRGARIRRTWGIVAGLLLPSLLPRRILLAQRALAVAVVLGVVAAALVPYPSSFSTPDWSGLAGGAAFFVGFAVGLEALER